MEPPTYNEATMLPSAVAVEDFEVCPPPSYYASVFQHSNPPPYQETNPFPVLMPTFFNAPQTFPGLHSTPPAAVVSQPTSEPTSTTSNLLGSPGSVRCPHCRRDIVTKIKQMPSKRAYTLCCVLSFSGLVCGFCLIPFMIPDLWDVHHYCPHCGKHLHVHHKS